LSIRPIAGLSLLHLERPASGGGRLLGKSVFDLTIGSLLFLLTLPLMLTVGLAIRLTSRGPTLFRQTRVGVDGREFTMYKFRSMVTDAESRREDLMSLSDGNGVLFKMRQDPRVTKVGRVIRRLSIDELPQLINIVKGDMSLVGPRPPLPEEVAGYNDDASRRLRLRPGLTGLWQSAAGATSPGRSRCASTCATPTTGRWRSTSRSCGARSVPSFGGQAPTRPERSGRQGCLSWPTTHSWPGFKKKIKNKKN